MALFDPPAPELQIEPVNDDQLNAHRRAAFYKGDNPVFKYHAICYYGQQVLGIDMAPFHQYWILTYCFMGKGPEWKEHFDLIGVELFKDISLSDQELRFEPKKLGMEVISFRGSIKSTIFQMVASWEVQNGRIDIAVGTYSLGQIAKEWMPNFKRMLKISKESLQLEWVYKTDNEDRKVIIWFEIDKNGKKKEITSRLMGFGQRGAIRMVHPDLWFIDDWLDKKMETTIEEAERVFKQEVFGTRTPGSRFVVIGTILAEGDMLFKIKSGELGGKFFNFTGSYPGYLNEAEKIARWFKRGSEFMEEQKDVQGEIIFQIEFMLNPISDKQALIKTKFIDAAKEAGKDLCLGRKIDKNALSVSGNDFQISGSANADWGVSFNLEFFTDGSIKPKIRILEMERYQGYDELEIVNLIEENNSIYEHAMIGFETNGFQVILANIYMRNNILWPIYKHDTGSERNHFQIGIPSLKQVFTNYDIAIPWDCESCREKMAIFVKELQGWQYSKEKKRYVFKGRFKDTTLAFWIAVMTMRMVETGKVSITAVD